MIRDFINLMRDRERLYNIVFEAETPAGKRFDMAVMTAIVVSIFVMFIESIPHVRGHFKDALEIAEGILTAFFTMEYILRIYCSKHWKNYAFSFFGIIDFIATIPPYLVWLFPQARYMLIFRTFRFIRVFRVFKLFAFLNEGFLLLESIRRSMTKIIVYFLFVCIMVLCIGTLMFIVEGGAPGSELTDLPTSIYWAIVTLTTVGYGDIVPVTPIGKILSSIVMILGYTIIAVPTGIVSATMIDVTKDSVKNGECPRCGGKVDAKKDRYCRHCGEKL